MTLEELAKWYEWRARVNEELSGLKSLAALHRATAAALRELDDKRTRIDHACCNGDIEDETDRLLEECK